MRIAILSIAFLFLAFSAQSQVLKSAGVWYFLDVDSMTARPAVLPNGTELAYVVGTKTVYYWNRNTSTWTAYGSTFNRDSIYFDASIIGSGTVSDPWGVDSTLFATIAGVGDSIAAALGYVAANFFPLQGGTLTGTGGNGFVGFPLQSSPPSTPATGFSLFAGSTGNNISWMQPDGFFRRLVSPVTGTPRQYQFMARSYTIGDSADIVNNVTSIAANYLATSNGSNLVARNLFDNNTYVGILNNKPWQFGQWTTAGRPTGVNGYTGFNTSFNWPEIYSVSGWFSPARAATTGGAFTAGYIPFGGTGGLTESANLLFSGGVLSLIGNRSTYTAESTVVKAHEYLFFESIGTTATQYEDVFNIISSTQGRGAVVEIQVADGTNSLHTSSYIILTGDPGTTNWYVAPGFNINNVGNNDIRLDVKNDGAAFRTYFRLRRVSGSTVANVAIRVRVISYSNVVTVERVFGTGTTTAPTLIWPLGNQITQSGGFVGIGTVAPTYGLEIVKDLALRTVGLFFKTSPEASTGRESENIFYESIGAAGAYEDVFNVITTQGGRGAVVYIDVTEGNSGNYFTNSYMVHCNEVGNTNYHQLIPIFSTSGVVVMDAKHDPAQFRTYFRLRRASGSGTINCSVKVRVASNSAGNPLLERVSGTGTTTAPTTFFPFSNYIYQGGNKVGMNTLSPNYDFDIVSTNALGLPRGTVAQRPTIAASTTPFRYNTDSTALEYGESVGTWRQIATRAYARSLVSALPTTNIYTANGTLTGNRTLTGADYSLSLDNISAFNIMSGGVTPASTIISDVFWSQTQYYNQAKTRFFKKYHSTDTRTATADGNPNFLEIFEVGGLGGITGFEWGNMTSFDTINSIYYYKIGGRYSSSFCQFMGNRPTSGSVNRLLTLFDFNNNIAGNGAPGANVLGVRVGTDSLFSIKQNGVVEMDKYGTPATTAAVLSKTLTNYGVGFATDGTVTSREIKRDTTIYIDDADYDFSAAITTAQIASRYNRVIFWMTTTAAAGSDSELTLHTPDANLLQVEYLIHSVDEPSGFDNKIVFGTNNAVDSTNGLVTNYYPGAGDGIHIRAGLRSGVYKYRYSN